MTSASDLAAGTNSKKSRIRILGKWVLRFAVGFVLLVACFCLSVYVLARIPVNRGFQHTTGEFVEILLINNGVHVDLIVPLDASAFELRSIFQDGNYRTDPNLYSHAIVGWGNRKFYLETETWDDLKVSNVLYAFTGLGETTVHVDLTTDFLFRVKRDKQRLLRLSDSQFRSLCEHIVNTLKKDGQGNPIPIDCKPYGESDCFFEGNGSYHIFRTCNVWVGEGLKRGGVRVGVWTVTPNSLFACLPDDAPIDDRPIKGD